MGHLNDRREVQSPPLAFKLRFNDSWRSSRPAGPAREAKWIGCKGRCYACEKREIQRECYVSTIVKYLRVLVYQKGIMDMYLSPKGITVSMLQEMSTQTVAMYLRVPVYQKGNHGLVPQSANVPGGNHDHVPQSANVPGGGKGWPSEQKASPSKGLPQGRVHWGDLSATATGFTNHNLGVEGALYPGVLPGDHVVPKNAARDQGGLFRSPEYSQLPSRVPQSANVPGGNHGSVPQSANVPGGNHGSVPQSANVPGGNHGTGLDVRQQAAGGGPFDAVDQSGVPHGGSAQQWLGAPEPQSKLDLLLADGITQLQAAMLKQYDKAKDNEKGHESIKPGTNVLPTLKDPSAASADTACVDIMDWLELIDAPMSDISDGSAAWWRGVVKEAHRAYGAWSLANPVEKLTIMPDITHLEGGQWARVNSRAATMLITALPEAVRQEAVARRLANSSTKLVYRLLQIYQPGGENEKVKILGHLQAPPTESDPQRAVESLRTWNRWLRRCRELNVQAPDPSLLCRGLNGLVRQVLEKNPDASFRTSLLKSNLRVDTNPSYESIERYYRHLMGECEALAVGMTTSTTTANPPAKAEPKLKPVRDPKVTQPSSTPPKATSASTSSTTTVTELVKYDKAKSEVPCKFFGKTARGCARTNRCPFSHSWEGLDKKDRCLACGGKGHLQKECPNKKYTPPSSQSGTPKGGSDKQQNPSSPTSPAATRTVRIDDKPEVADVPPRGAAESDHGAEIREVLADVGRVLKSMTATSLKKLEVNANSETRAKDDYELDEAQIKNVKTQEPDGLLDSGASHPMRQASHQEYANSAPVRVTLAGEDEKILRQNSKGTILVQEENSRVQPIVPLGAIIEDLGYTLHWTPTKLRLTHPEKGMIKVRVNNHCPEVAACDALAMIHELEMKQVNSLNYNLEALKARLDVMKLQDTRDWTELLRGTE